MIQTAKRSKEAAPCTCGKQPMHVCRQDGRYHLYECPPCGVKTGKYASDALALMAWRGTYAKPQLRSVPPPPFERAA